MRVHCHHEPSEAVLIKNQESQIKNHSAVIEDSGDKIFAYLGIG